MIKNTINEIRPYDCTGCGACLNKCPVGAIKMEYNDEGFLYPKITDGCVNCGQCLAVCPVQHPVKQHPTPASYAVWADDAVRKESSSGGMFTLLSKYVLDKKGAVCGAVFAPDFQTVYHGWAENMEQLAPLRSSKYVQSDTGLAYKKAKEYLDAGRPVLYSGTPCQIAGLYNFLGKDYENLYTADIVCHGANSVTAYQSFINEFAGGKEIEKINFRDKYHFEWSTSLAVYFKDGSVKKAVWNDNYWNKGFLDGVINRINCHHCPYACAERVGDISLGDCWQVHRYNKAYDDRKGTSLVLVNSEKGRKLFDIVSQQMKLCQSVPLEEMRKYNGQLNRPPRMGENRKFFFSHLPEMGYHKALWYGMGRRFDVGIVGWWFASNYGSSLTYYALGTVLEDMGKKTLLIPVAKSDGHPWEKEIKQTVDFLGGYFQIGRERDFDKMHEFNDFCDSFMLGSDQLWAPSYLKSIGYTFFLDFADKDHKKIAFSTSFGHSTFTADKQVCETAGDYLKRFSAISVREKSGIDICRDSFGVEVQQVFDPVFLCPREKYDILTAKVNDPLPRKYLLCYVLDPTPEKEAAARRIAEREGLEIITILGMKEYSYAKDKWHTGRIMPKVTSEQFLYYIKNCAFLMTDSHHGTCYGIIYHRQYVALANAARGKTRFETVASALELTDRVFDNPTDVLTAEHIYEPIDYNKVDALLEKEKATALDWLKKALDAPVAPAEDTIRTLAVDMDRKARGFEISKRRIQQECDRKIEEFRRKAESEKNPYAIVQRQATEIAELREEQKKMTAAVADMKKTLAATTAETKSTLAALNELITTILVESSESAFSKTLKKARKMFDKNKE